MRGWRATWVVDGCILKDATPVGASNIIGEDDEPTRDVIISLLQFIRKDFPILVVPCIINLKGGKICFFAI